ncbi:beta-lactamase-like protein [Chaetomidium leptoderma]|uniref:Beta-lactamase-like protein n=1 Tax=Chaetomidium leptoderma TaxID=669021 RepID=A0AAN6ZTK5_9PEZI|nr:beta-lactamase-like protein [Chaetomidium leptoderma]
MAETAARSVPPPDLDIPPSPHTVDVSIIDTTATIRGISAHLFLSPPIKGYDWMAAPVFSFLVRHPGLNRSIIFDLGIRKDWQNLSPQVLSQIQSQGWKLNVEKDVREILDDAGVDANHIEAIIWSHHHFDHVGDPSTFPPSTSLIVGPGFKSMMPGYPANPDSTILESSLANRQLIELDFESGESGSKTFEPLTIGRFRALDYFGDGSFYLVDSPGHTIGHISALARVTASPASFILLTGDAIHHPGEIRPSKHLPLPENIIPDPFAPDPHPLESHYGCPAAVFDSLFAGRGRPACGPVYEPARAGNSVESFHDDVDEVLRTTGKLQEVDAHDNVFVAAAHDEALLDHVVFFPEGTMNAFAAKRWVKRVRWRFLRDFGGAVDKVDHELGRRRWGPGGEGGMSSMKV